MDRIVGQLARRYAVAGVLITIGVVGGVILAQRQHLAEFPEKPEKKEAEPAAKTVAPAAANESGLAEGARPAEAPAKDERAERQDGKARAPFVVERLGARRVSCAAACGLEAQCGFRSASDCRAASCEEDLRKLSQSDFALEGLADCAALAENPCAEACWKRGECSGHHEGDRQCTEACRTIVRQAPRESYRESRCVIERACGELPLCAERG